MLELCENGNEEVACEMLWWGRISGARVSFDVPQPARLFGTLGKFNRKTVMVMTDTGRRWSISRYLLASG